jgi:hypothetical protein
VLESIDGLTALGFVCDESGCVLVISPDSDSEDGMLTASVLNRSRAPCPHKGRETLGLLSPPSRCGLCCDVAALLYCRPCALAGWRNPAAMLRLWVTGRARPKRARERGTEGQWDEPAPTHPSTPPPFPMHDTYCSQPTRRSQQAHAHPQGPWLAARNDRVSGLLARKSLENRREDSQCRTLLTTTHPAPSNPLKPPCPCEPDLSSPLPFPSPPHP